MNEAVIDAALQCPGLHEQFPNPYNRPRQFLKFDSDMMHPEICKGEIIGIEKVEHYEGDGFYMLNWNGRTGLYKITSLFDKVSVMGGTPGYIREFPIEALNGRIVARLFAYTKPLDFRQEETACLRRAVS